MAMDQTVVMVALFGAVSVFAALGLSLRLGGHHRVASFALALGHGVPTKSIGGEGREKLNTHGELPLGDNYLLVLNLPAALRAIAGRRDKRRRKVLRSNYLQCAAAYIEIWRKTTKSVRDFTVNFCYL